MEYIVVLVRPIDSEANQPWGQVSGTGEWNRQVEGCGGNCSAEKETSISRAAECRDEKEASAGTRGEICTDSLQLRGRDSAGQPCQEGTHKEKSWGRWVGEGGERSGGGGGRVVQANEQDQDKDGAVQQVNCQQMFFHLLPAGLLFAPLS